MTGAIVATVVAGADTIIHIPALDAMTDRGHCSNDLMARHLWKAAAHGINLGVEVRMADTTGLHLHEDLAVARLLHRNIFQRQTFAQGFEGRSLVALWQRHGGDSDSNGVRDKVNQSPLSRWMEE